MKTNLREQFNEVVFIKEDHKYLTKNTGCRLTSATQLIDKFKPKFDPKGYIVKAVAKRENKTVNEIYQQWDFKKNNALTKGTYIHNTIESMIDGIEVVPTNNNEIEWYRESLIVKNEFINDLNGELLNEVLVYDIDLGIAGQIDLLEVLEDGSVNVYDYKTNESITTDSRYNTKMLGELSYLDDCSLNHYQLQLNIYRHLLELKGIKVNSVKIIHINKEINIYDVSKDDKSIEIVTKQSELIKQHNKNI